MGTLFNLACIGGVKLHVLIFFGNSPFLWPFFVVYFVYQFAVFQEQGSDL